MVKEAERFKCEFEANSNHPLNPNPDWRLKGKVEAIIRKQEAEKVAQMMLTREREARKRALP